MNWNHTLGIDFSLGFYAMIRVARKIRPEGEGRKDKPQPNFMLLHTLFFDLGKERTWSWHEVVIIRFLIISQIVGYIS